MVSPGMIGLSKGYFRVTANYRNQWAAFGNPYQTMAFGVDAPVIGNQKKSRSYLGAGLHVFNDKAGLSSLKKLQITGGLSGTLVMGQSRLTLGMDGAFVQRSMSTGGLAWDSQFINGSLNTAAPTGEAGGGASRVFWDFATGMGYLFEKKATNMSSNDHVDILVAAGVYHLLQPSQGLFGGERLSRRYSGTIQARVGIRSSNLSVMPKILFQMQNTLREISAGAIFQYVLQQGSNVTGFKTQSGIGLGASYRLGDAIIPEFNYYYGNWLVGVSYDINVSNLTAYSYGRGGFEISARYVHGNGPLFGKNANRTLF